MSKNTLIIVVATGSMAIGFLLAFFLFLRAEIVEVEVGSETLKYVLPADAIELTPCIPQHGSHWGKAEDHDDPEADIQGPTYLLSEADEVIGIEYHVSMDYLERVDKEVGGQISKLEAGEITYAELKIASLIPDFDLLGKSIQQSLLTYLSLGHPGFETSHIDIHAYTISKEEMFRICLN